MILKTHNKFWQKYLLFLIFLFLIAKRNIRNIQNTMLPTVKKQSPIRTKKSYPKMHAKIVSKEKILLFVPFQVRLEHTISSRLFHKVGSLGSIRVIGTRVIHISRMNRR
jgi:hypothetical protein